ncbi:MAG TPA: SIS domain-containing protein [Longimicrobiales bacterium]|nr:SIS domain-containing protein [Longimicrobiales bacterium]
MRRWLDEARAALDTVSTEEVGAALQVLLRTREAGGTLFAAGNGGSATTCSHLALDFQRAVRADDGLRTRATSLADSVGSITAWANDEAYAAVFSRQLELQARPGDCLIVASVSGDSPNLVAAVAWAREHGLSTVGLLGREGGALRAMVDAAVVVRSHDYGWVESAHLVLEHVLTCALKLPSGAVGA